VRINHAVSQSLVSDEGQVAVVGGDVRVDEDRSSGLQCEITACTEGIADRDIIEHENIVVGLQDDVLRRGQQISQSRGRNRNVTTRTGAKRLCLAHGVTVQVEQVNSAFVCPSATRIIQSVIRLCPHG